MQRKSEDVGRVLRERGEGKGKGIGEYINVTDIVVAVFDAPHYFTVYFTVFPLPYSFSLPFCPSSSILHFHLNV